MFNLGGWGEVLIIAVTALIVLKPEDLPKVMHQLGRWMLTLRRLKYQLQTHYLDALYATEREDMQRQVREDQGTQPPEVPREEIVIKKNKGPSPSEREAGAPDQALPPRQSAALSPPDSR